MSYDQPCPPSQQFPKRRKGALDNDRLVLEAPCPGNPGVTSRLVWAIRKNNPGITIYTNDPADRTEKTNNGRITANMDCITFSAFLNALEQYASQPEEGRTKIENYETVWAYGKPSESPVLMSETWVGRDKDGVVFISVLAAGRPRIRFNLGFGLMHRIYHGDGTPFSTSEISVASAKAHVRILTALYGPVLVAEYLDPQIAKDKKAAANGGGGQRGYTPPGNAAPTTQQGDGSLDDLPF